MNYFEALVCIKEEIQIIGFFDVYWMFIHLACRKYLFQLFTQDRSFFSPGTKMPVWLPIFQTGSCPSRLKSTPPISGRIIFASVRLVIKLQLNCRTSN